MLIEMGFQVIIVTHSRFTGIPSYWNRYGASTFWAAKGDAMINKIDVSSFYPIDWEKTIGIGDDITDDCFLGKCKYPYLVADHHPFYKVQESVTHYAHTKYPALNCNGGSGVLADIFSKIDKGLI